MMILLIIGNGVSVDLCLYLELNVTPSSPLQFDVPDPFDGSKKLLDTLSKVRDMIKVNPGRRDFDVIQDFVTNYPKNKEDEWLHCELRHYLSLACSHLNDIVLIRWKKNWRWQKWIDRNYKEISGVFIINYDLVIETTLSNLTPRPSNGV